MRRLKPRLLVFLSLLLGGLMVGNWSARAQGITGVNSVPGQNLNIGAGGNLYMTITTSGLVAIGTTNPAALLNVTQSNSNLATEALTVTKDFSGGGNSTPTAEIYGTDSGVGETGIQIGVKGNSGFGNGAPLNVLSNGNTIATFTYGGNVGIGTTSPGSTLTVNGNLTFGPMNGGGVTYGLYPLSAGFGTDTNALALGGGGNAADSTRGAYINMIGNNVSYLGLYGDLVMGAGQATSGSGGNILFGTDPTHGSTSGTIWRMVILNNGYIGIGTTAPQGNLDIENGSNTAQLCLNSQCTTSISSLSHSFGGAYGLNQNNSPNGSGCDHPNPVTGGYNCPSGYNDSIVFNMYYAWGACPNAQYYLHMCWK
jgi:hypothetical protein